MNKTELIEQVSQQTGLARRDVERGLNAALEIITGQLAQGERVQLVGFGAFECKLRAARTGRNPKTGEAVAIEAGRSPVFKAGKALKEAVSG